MDIQNAYDEWSATYDADENLTRDLDRTTTHSLLADFRPDSILELGCGTGKNTVFLVRIGKQVHALDFSQGMVEKARAKVQAENVRFEMADLTLLWPCEAGAYDLIVCSLVLEHIENLSHIFSEARRTLRLGGNFFLNELHPFKQYDGKKARFSRGIQTAEVDTFVHHISDFIGAALENGLKLLRLSEYWHEEDAGKLPRLVSFLLEK